MKYFRVRSTVLRFELCSRGFRRGVQLWALVLAFMGWGPLLSVGASEVKFWTMLSQAQVDSTGVFLDQVLSSGPTNSAMHIRISDAPAVGKLVTLSRAQVQALVAAVAPDVVDQGWEGAASIQILRRTRPLPESEILQAIHSHLLKNAVKAQGELEVRFLRVWNPVTIPDEDYSLRISDLPQGGLTSIFQIRFELLVGRESLGVWQIGVEARLFRNVWVSRQQLRRSDAVSEGDFALERRDVLRTRDMITEDTDLSHGWQMVENLNPGQPALRRSVQPRAVILRGQMVDALLKDGQISISLKAEVLDSGVPGQLIRLRNPISRKELRGKVINEQMVQIQM